MSAVAGQSARNFQASLALDNARTKGLVLSHALGFALFAEFAFNFIRVEVPFTPILSLPIRLIALWLILDRNWRLGPTRLCL